MVSKKSVGSAVSVLCLGALAFGGACSAVDVVNPSDDGAQGGSATGGAGSGGATTGGASSGGTNTGGASSGGTNTGGASSGGATTGGVATGGTGFSGAAGSTSGTAGVAGTLAGGAGGVGGTAGAGATGGTAGAAATGGTAGSGAASGASGAAGTGPGCSGGQILCNSVCTDTQTSPVNCGACGTACLAGQVCSMGRCAMSCASGTTLCNNACVNTMTSASNCGACGTTCATGQTCTNGSCMGGTTTTGVIGWAAVSGNGVTTTTGGAGGTTIDVSSASALSSAASSSARQIIRLTASVSVSSLVVGSNKTIVGVGPNIVISGGIELNNQNNVILQNFRLNGASSGVSAGDGIRITNSHHIWIDHLEVYDALDGNLDITDRSNFITVSWTKFRYSTNSGDHRYSNLIGAGDAETGDEPLLNVTWHHNWWAQNVHERMPRVRFGDVHVFNNYYSSSGNNYCIRAGFHSNVLIENNHFQGVGKPHEIGEDSGTAIVTARGNTYSSTSGAQATRGTAFTPPYPYTLDAVGTVSAAVQSGAGPH